MAGERVLVVDDEEAVRASIGAVLSRSGYTPVLAASTSDAVDLLQADPMICLMLADVMLPDVDGLRLLDQIVLDYPTLPVVVFTGIQEIQVAISAFRRGASDYLLKPVEPEQMLAAVGRAVEQARLRQLNLAYREHLEQMVAARTRKLRAAMLDLERSYDITLEAMGDALDLRDAETEGHSRRVTAYTTAIAREMGLDAGELRVIARGAFLHDIGKIATPDSVLLKPGRLDGDEMARMREHCRLGYEMIKKIPFLSEASEIIYAHQECFDGTGYPRGLKGEEIPLGARIFAIADTLDAITSDRPYRKGRGFAEAREEIRRCSGTQFDPQIVEVYLRIPAERWSELRAGVQAMSSAVGSAALCRPEREPCLA
jgi:putative nucleotidyltransferase with HDIG domain